MIQIEKLCKRYGESTVVDDVSMVIEPRTMTTIVGTSGSGKSTLLRMINRLVEPTSGRVLIDGNETTAEPAHLLATKVHLCQNDGQPAIGDCHDLAFLIEQAGLVTLDAVDTGRPGQFRIGGGDWRRWPRTVRTYVLERD